MGADVDGAAVAPGSRPRHRTGGSADAPSEGGGPRTQCQEEGLPPHCSLGKAASGRLRRPGQTYFGSKRWRRSVRGHPWQEMSGGEKTDLSRRRGERGGEKGGEGPPADSERPQIHPRAQCPIGGRPESAGAFGAGTCRGPSDVSDHARSGTLRVPRGRLGVGNIVQRDPAGVDGLMGPAIRRSFDRRLHSATPPASVTGRGCHRQFFAGRVHFPLASARRPG